MLHRKSRGAFAYRLRAWVFFLTPLLANGSACGSSPGQSEGRSDTDPTSDGVDTAPQGSTTRDSPTASGSAADATSASADSGDESSSGSVVVPPEPQPWTFELWLPGAQAVEVVFDDPAFATVPLDDTADGFWSATVPFDELIVGATYRFVVSNPDLELPDPRALAIAPGDTRSALLPRELAWPSSEANFERPTLSTAIIYELHIGSFNQVGGEQGTFETAIARLDHLADLGVNVIELMPSAEFPGELSWGYNPAFPFAVERAYGGVDGLAQFVAEAHRRDIAVILDVVYNHFDGNNILCRFSSTNACNDVYFGATPTQWGPRPDFAEAGVREYLLDNVRLWVETFHLDGFRWDSTSNIWATDNGSGPRLEGGDTFLIDGNRFLDDAGSNYLSVAEDFNGGSYATDRARERGLGFDTQWDGGFHSAIVRALEADQADVEDVANSLRWRYSGRTFARVVYTESHDTTGFFGGDSRLVEQLDPNDPDSFDARKLASLGLSLTLTAPGVPMLLQGQEFLQPGSFHQSHALDWQLAQQNAGIVQLARDLIALRTDPSGPASGLTAGNVDIFHQNPAAGVLAFRRWSDVNPGGETVVIVNFADRTFDSYLLGAPNDGTWTVRFNSDDKRYDPDFGGVGTNDATALNEGRDGLPFSLDVALGSRSLVVLSR